MIKKSHRYNTVAEYNIIRHPVLRMRVRVRVRVSEIMGTSKGEG